jgi:hypothetical protein
MPDERCRLRKKAIDLIALLCFHGNDLAIAIIMSFLRALALRTAARVDVINGEDSDENIIEGSDESIIDQFGRVAMGGRRDGAELEFPITISNVAKPKSSIKRLLLRRNPQGQWKYVVDKTKKTLRGLSWIDYQGSFSFAEAVRLRIQFMHYDANSYRWLAPISVLPHVTLEEFRRTFHMISPVFDANGLPLELIDIIWQFWRPNVVPERGSPQIEVVSLLASDASPQQRTAAADGAAAQVADDEEVSVLGSGASRAAGAQVADEEVSVVAPLLAVAIIDNAESVSLLSSLGSGASQPAAADEE